MKKSDIDATVQWAATELGVEEQDSLWKTNVACTFLIFDLLDDAIENFRLALELDKANWDAHYRLADIYQQEARYDSAIEALAYPMQEFRDNEALVAEHRSVYYLMTTLLGHCYEKKSEYNKAIELYQAELCRDPEAWELVEALMNALRAGEKYDQLMNFMAQDKKAQAGKLTLILTRGIGSAFVSRDIEESAVRDLWREVVPG